MSHGDAAAELQKMRAALQAMEQRLSSGAVPVAGIQDLKSGVDDLRLRLWAILSASNNPDPAAALERFRYRRAIEILDAVTGDLAAGHLRSTYKEVDMLRGSAERFMAAARTVAKVG